MRTRLCDQPVVRIPKGQGLSSISTSSAISSIYNRGVLEASHRARGRVSFYFEGESLTAADARVAKSKGENAGSPRWVATARRSGPDREDSGEQQVNPASRSRVRALPEAGAGGWGKQTEVRVWDDLPSRASTRGASRTHPRSKVGAGPRPPRSRAEPAAGACAPGGARPRAPAPPPSPCARRRRCPSPEPPRCRSAQAGGPVRPAGGAALLRVRRRRRARAACPRPRGRPRPPPRCPRQPRAGASPTVGRGRGAAI